MTKKELSIRFCKAFDAPGNTTLALATLILYNSIMTFAFHDVHIWTLESLFLNFINFSTLEIISLWVCKFLANRLFKKDITIYSIFIFCLLMWALCVPICLYVNELGFWIDKKSSSPTDSFYIRLIMYLLIVSVAIVQTFGYIIKQRNEERIILIDDLKSEREKATKALLNTLKLQLDPHFMFNSLGTLSGIIVENPQMALEFNNRLARIYKYIVAHISDDTIPLHEGISFIQDYCQHIEMRYKDNFIFDIADDICHDTEEKILPLSLQLLVENAVKHNQHSAEAPLHITIHRNGDFVCVTNELKPYEEMGCEQMENTGIGIKNLFDRYKLLTQKIPIVLLSDTTYTVQIPIIKKIQDFKLP